METDVVAVVDEAVGVVVVVVVAVRRCLRWRWAVEKCPRLLDHFGAEAAGMPEICRKQHQTKPAIPKLPPKHHQHYN
jgi:hypothetical protein